MKYLTRREAAAYIKDRFGQPCSAAVLAQHAVDGTGPIYFRFGRAALYTPEDVARWCEERAKPIRRSSEIPWGKKRGRMAKAEPPAPEAA
jgi:hypothetical protein